MSARLVLSLASTLFSWLCAGCTLHFFWYFFRTSEIFADKLRPRALKYGYFVLACIGVGYCVFRGAEATLQWMPRKWVTLLDEGDSPIWIGYEIAGTVTFFGSLAFMYELEKLAERIREWNLAERIRKAAEDREPPPPPTPEPPLAIEDLEAKKG